MNDFEQQMAVAMKKAKNKSKMPIEARKNLMLEKIKSLKNTLKRNIKEGDKPKIKETYKTLVNLRAKLSVLQILEIKKNYDVDSMEKEDNIIYNYVTDCTKLKKAINKFL